jgi:hypothetical protein
LTSTKPNIWFHATAFGGAWIQTLDVAIHTSRDSTLTTTDKDEELKVLTAQLTKAGALLPELFMLQRPSAQALNAVWVSTIDQSEGAEHADARAHPE